MMNKSLGLLAVGLLFAPMAGWASVIYDFTTPIGGGQSFSYTHPAFITIDVFQCDSNGPVDCRDINFILDSGPLVGEEGDPFDVVQLATHEPDGSGNFNFFFPNGAFLQFGEYDDFNGDGHLVVRPSSVPEPGTLSLLGLGLLGLGVTRRRAN